MRVFGFIVLLLTFVSFTKHNNDYLLLNSKTFTVEGSTSIGNFSCDYDIKTKDTLFLNQKIGLSYKIPVKEFGCGNFMLNRDFRKTLKEKEHPTVLFSLSDVRKQGQNYLYNLNLKIAGKEKSFKDLVLTKEGKELKGKIELKFGDFNLTPPQKLGGAIKIKEEIKLSISLKPEN